MGRSALGLGSHKEAAPSLRAAGQHRQLEGCLVETSPRAAWQQQTPTSLRYAQVHTACGQVWQMAKCLSEGCRPGGQQRLAYVRLAAAVAGSMGLCKLQTSS